MLERDNLLDVGHLREKTASSFQPVKRVYEENILRRNSMVKPFFLEEQVLRADSQHSNGYLSGKNVGRLSSLPLVYW